jgi:2-polyprenyl-3-methyl-5-hydroxy-6-metoxy-1,4-benzoquinol methylase
MKYISKFDIQDKLYEFPYHYLPYLRANIPRLHRYLSWGLDYLTYTSFVVEQIEQIAPASLLDVGCGDGRLINFVKSSVPRVYGVDLSEQALAFARAFNPDVEFKCADVATLSGTYEIITLIEVLEHLPDEQIKGFLQNVARLLHREGRLLVTVPTINVPLNKKHYRHYDLDLLQTTLGSYFEIERYWWLYQRGLLERCLRTIMVNRFYILNGSPVLSLIWRIHQHKTYFADASTGAHLVCLARLTE